MTREEMVLRMRAYLRDPNNPCPVVLREDLEDALRFIEADGYDIPTDLAFGVDPATIFRLER